MITRTISLSAPGASTVTLGLVDEATGTGFTLEKSTIYTPPRALATSDLPLVAGGLVVPGRYGTRRIDVSGTIVAPSPESASGLYRALVDVLRDRGNTPVTLTYAPEGFDRELEGFLDGEVEGSAAGGPYIAFRFRLVCPDPLAYGPTVNTGVAGASVTNAGNAEVYPTTVVALSGTVSSLRLGNTTTSSYLQLDGLPAGSTVTVEHRPGFESVELDGVPVLDKLNVASVFWPLVPGANDVYVTVLSGGGSASASLAWRDGWVS